MIVPFHDLGIAKIAASMAFSIAFIGLLGMITPTQGRTHFVTTNELYPQVLADIRLPHGPQTYASDRYIFRDSGDGSDQKYRKQ